MNDIFELSYQHQIKIQIITTYQCNFTCSYCIVGKDPLPGEDQLSYFSGENLQAFCIFLEKFVKTQSIVIHIIGGEPFINYKKLRTILITLGRIKKINLIYISTNGFFLNEAILIDLQKVRNNLHQVLQISFSIDGSPDISKHRSSTVWNKKVISNFYLTQKILGRDATRIAMVVSPDNSHFFNSNIQYLFSLNPGILEFALQKGIFWDKTSILKLIASFSIFIREYYKNQKVFSSVGFDIGINDLRNNNPCGKGMEHNITPEGYFIPCVSYLKKNSRNGNIFRYSLAEIIKLDKYKELMDWGKKYYYSSYSKEENPDRIHYSYCFYSAIDSDEKLKETFDNINLFDKYRKKLLTKLSSLGNDR